MIKKLFFLSFILLLFSYGFSQENVKNKNMQNIVWENETHVIKCSEFNITKPLREVVAEHPIIENKINPFTEYPDKKGRPVQTFEYTFEKNGIEYGSDPEIIQNTKGKSLSKEPIVNWEGQVASGFRPFDPTGAAGPDHYIQMINATNYRIYDKTGTALLTGSLGDLWSPSTPNSGDPIILYDKAADRWFLSQFGQTGNKMYIAISQTSDPLGSWYTYTFSSPDFPDYLKFSAWQDGYYMTANYAQKIFAFNRAKMLAGDGTAEAVYKTFSPPQSGFFVPLPADASDGVMPGAGTPCPIFSYSDNGWGGGNIDAVNIYNASVNWSGTPSMTVTSAGALPTAAFDASYDANWDDIAQPGTSQKLDGIGGCLMFRAQWKTWPGYNTVVLSWGVKISTNQRGIFWCELRQNQSNDSWSIYQQGIYAPGTDYYWMSSAAMDNGGNIALCYAKANGTNTYMSLAYTGRLASDPLGTMPIAEVVAQAGAGSQTAGNRNGDYSHTSLDPDGYTFWHTGEYIKAGGSAGTRVYSFKFTSPEDPQAFSAQGISTTQIDLSWNLNTNNEPALVAWSPDGVFGTPVDGVTYSAGQSIPGGGTVLAYGTSPLTYSHTGLTPATNYYYKAWSYKTDNTYSGGIAATASTLTGDPISLEAVTMSKYQIDLSWTLNNESNDVVVAWSADGNFGTLTNGNTYTAGEVISGGGQVLYVGNNTVFSHVSLNPGTQYFYKAWSKMTGDVYSPGITANATTDPDAIFYDDFETETGWTMNGEWQIDAPQGLGGDHGNPDPSSAVSGTKILGLDLTGLGTYPGDYENNLATKAQTAVSPTIDCSNYSNVNIVFQKQLGVESPTYDHAYLEISTNGGSTWTQLWANTASVEDATWSQQTFDVSSYADGQSNVKFRFSIGATDDSWQYCGWNIDNFLVYGASNTPTYSALFTVTDINTSNPIQGAQISINGSTYTTNASGISTISLPDGDFPYTVSAPGYSNSTGNVTVSGAEISEDVSLSPLPVYTVTFTVIDAATTNAIENASININGEDIVTNASGVATIDLYSATFPYTVSAAGYDNATGNVTVAGATQTVDVELNLTAYNVTFNVKESNGTTAIQDAIVDFDGTQLNTNASGTAVFNDYVPGTYNWSVNKAGYIEQTGSTTITDADKSVNINLIAESNSIIGISNSEINIYPNPSSGIINIDIQNPDDNTIIKINDVTGRIIYNGKLVNSRNSIDLSNNTKGIYFINFIYKGNTINSKIILD